MIFAKLKKSLTSLAVAFKFRRTKLGAEGTGCIYKSLRSEFPFAEKLYLSDNVHIGPGALLDAAGEIHIGTGTILAPSVTIFSRTHNFDVGIKAIPFDNVMLLAPVRIGKYVWIGSSVIVLPGVTIGDGAIIGAGTVVSKDVPSLAVAVGNPARVVKFRNEDTFRRLLSEDAPFVYQRLGHGKVMKARNTRPGDTDSEE